MAVADPSSEAQGGFFGLQAPDLFGQPAAAASVVLGRPLATATTFPATGTDAGYSSYASAGFSGRPECSILAAGLPRWLCDVVGQLPRAGLMLSPVDGDELLFFALDDLKVSGVIVHGANSSYSLDAAKPGARGLQASLSGIGFRFHTDLFEVSADDCICFLRYVQMSRRGIVQCPDLWRGVCYKSFFSLQLEISRGFLLLLLASSISLPRMARFVTHTGAKAACSSADFFPPH